MVRLLATVLGAALLSSSTFAAPMRGVHRRTMPEDQPATSMMQEPPMPEPPMMNEPPMPEPPMMSEPPKMEEPPMSEPPMSEPPMSEPPMMEESEPPMMEEPPKSTPPMEEPPMSSPPMEEPPKSTGMMDEPPKSTPPMEEPPKSTPPMSEPPMSEPPMSEPPMSEPPMSEPPMSQPPESTTMKEDKPPMSEPPKPMPSYGSGSNPWSPTYDDCVQKCIADYGSPKEYTWTPPPKEEKKPGAKPTHTVMVAPVDNVLRFMPFALNATVGDTVRFVWTGKNEHSVTMSSAMSVCNKSQTADAFDSGLLTGKDGEKTFDVEVKNDQPTWFFCSFGNHCSKGMFGGINLKAAFGDQKSVGVMMNKWVENNPDLQAAWTYVQNKTAGTPAERWGNSISVADIPEDKHLELAQNVLWTRANLAENPGMQEMGSAQTPDNSPLKLVGDLSTLLAESNSPQVVQQPGSESSAPAPQPTESKKSGALPSYSSAAVVSVLALLASVLVM